MPVTIIAKNNTGSSDVSLEDLGVTVPYPGQVELVGDDGTFTLVEVASSKDLYDAVDDLSIVINDGTSDLSEADGKDHISLETKYADDSETSDSFTEDFGNENLANLATKNHGDLDSVTADQHHAKNHTSTHGEGAADPLKLDDLAIPDDNTDLNASSSRHGLLPKLPGGSSNFLREDGAWATPSGGGNVSGSGTPADNAIPKYDGVSGTAIQPSGILIDDSDNVTNVGTINSVDIAAHASRHASGGADAIKLDDLSAPDDNTDLDASTSKHGLLSKLPGGTTNFLRADGSWAAPAGGGGNVLEDYDNIFAVAESGAEYSTLAAALAAASPTGDERFAVLVAPGRYNELPRPVHNVDVIGIGPPESVVFYQTSGTDPLFYKALDEEINSHFVNIKFDKTTTTTGGVVDVDGYVGNSEIRFSACVFDLDTTNSATGMFANNGGTNTTTLIVEGCVIRVAATDLHVHITHGSDGDSIFRNNIFDIGGSEVHLVAVASGTKTGEFIFENNRAVIDVGSSNMGLVILDINAGFIRSTSNSFLVKRTSGGSETTYYVKADDESAASVAPVVESIGNTITVTDGNAFVGLYGDGDFDVAGFLDTVINSHFDRFETSGVTTSSIVSNPNDRATINYVVSGANGDLSLSGSIEGLEIFQDYDNVFVVAEDGAEYSSIAAALAAASPTGDERFGIFVAPGRYNETFNLKDMVDIIGLGAPEDAVVYQTSGSDDIIEVSDATTTIIDAHIKNIQVEGTGTYSGSLLEMYHQATLPEGDIRFSNCNLIAEFDDTNSEILSSYSTFNKAVVTIENCFISLAATGTSISKIAHINSAGNTVFRDNKIVISGESAISILYAYISNSFPYKGEITFDGNDIKMSADSATAGVTVFENRGGNLFAFANKCFVDRETDGSHNTYLHRAIAGSVAEDPIIESVGNRFEVDGNGTVHALRVDGDASYPDGHIKSHYDRFLGAGATTFNLKTIDTHGTIDCVSSGDNGDLTLTGDLSVEGSVDIKLDDLATPDDNTDLDATTSKHGLMPKYPGGSTFLRADGTWQTPASGGSPNIAIGSLSRSASVNTPASATLMTGWTAREESDDSLVELDTTNSRIYARVAGLYIASYHDMVWSSGANTVKQHYHWLYKSGVQIPESYGRAYASQIWGGQCGSQLACSIPITMTADQYIDLRVSASSSAYTYCGLACTISLALIKDLT